ncbi:hypothetical protein F5141DRAFT_1081275 [Pisolithus sp. B1]|nr:hypothetical protein F5141DRAFT_1081275 [Pisolithus sp. B1]
MWSHLFHGTYPWRLSVLYAGATSMQVLILGCIILCRLILQTTSLCPTIYPSSTASHSTSMPAQTSKGALSPRTTSLSASLSRRGIWSICPPLYITKGSCVSVQTHP